MDKTQLEQYLSNSFKFQYNESQNMGSLVVSIKGCLDMFKNVRDEKHKEYIISYVCKCIDSALVLTKENNKNNADMQENPTIVNFINLKGVVMSDLTKNVQLFIRKIIKHAQEKYFDIMVNTYLYNPPIFVKIAYGLFYPFIDPDTRRKISIVKQKNNKKQIIGMDDFCKE